jgi:microcystin degradation protein MlrC
MRVLIVECQQEVSSFNPVPSGYEDFQINRGAALLQARRGTGTFVGGALAVLDARPDVTVVPVYGAFACSAGTLAAGAYARLRGELLDGLAAAARDGADLVYFALHGAMAAEGEDDPEGDILERARALLGPAVPFVTSLDLHGIATARMLRLSPATVTLKTYPHVDHQDTGARAARLALAMLEAGARPVAARVRMPMLVRGDELKTETGLYGRFLERAAAIEREPGILAATIMIGNPFTDVPELCCQAIMVADGDTALASAAALRLAEGFFEQRRDMQARLVPLADAVAAARAASGTVILTDAADATSSGATGDSPEIVAALLAAGYPGRILAPLTDAPAAAAAHHAGIGARRRFRLGGTLDPRFRPLELEAEVTLLSDGNYELESWGTPERGGPSAVLRAGNLTLVATSRPVLLFDRSLFLAHGCDPRRFDAVVVKSPHCQPQFFDDWASANLNVDAAGSTSANLPRLGHRKCARPVFPLEPETTFEPRVELFG